MDAFLDQPVEIQRRAPDGGVVFDLGVEGVPTSQRAVPMQHPHDVVGQAGENRRMVGPPEAVDVRLYDGLV
jgi:hypothetical protein